jgi:hypothetical protein
MTNEVLALLAKLKSRCAGLRRIALLSPSPEERAMFPEATVFPAGAWNLNTPRPDLRFDLVIACHVFHYSLDPSRWFGNVLGSCRAFLLADVIWRKRSAESEFGHDGDFMRYAVGPHRPRVPRYFDLNSFGDRLLGYTTFDGGSNQYGDSRHVLALIRGDLTHPLLRVDDYPTGVRPILADMAPIHGLLDLFEARGIPFHLGIVPGILNDAMIRTLRGYRRMVPVQHGYDHRYPQCSALLLRKSDPFNERGTVGGFDEFRWQRFSTIERKLREGKVLLEGRLGRPVETYIPPCNRCNRATARALRALDFKLCLSQDRVPGGYVPVLRSDFYGRSADLGDGSLPEVIGLHATWEWDQQRKGDTMSLIRLLDRVLVETRAREATIDGLADAVSALT